MAESSLTTELDAVNFMLRAIGESPINDLEEPQLADAVTAKATLRRVSKREQQRGYHFNTDENYKLLANSSQFVLPIDTLKVDTVRASASKDVAQRGNKLYDRKNHSFTFTETYLYVDLVRHLEWDQLPEPARQYFMYLAATEFFVASFQEDPPQSLQRDLSLANGTFQEFLTETGDYNAIYSDYRTARTLQRSPLAGW